jgi:hypothetical protein
MTWKNVFPLLSLFIRSLHEEKIGFLPFYSLAFFFENETEEAEKNE